jgi:hypothetical protein
MHHEVKIKEVFTKVALKYGVSEAVIQDAYEFVFIKIKQRIQKPDLPDILIHNFGRFSVRLGALQKHLNWLKSRLENKTISEEEYTSKTEKYKEAYERLTAYAKYKRELKNKLKYGQSKREGDGIA